jgi:hypothetical protein
LPLVKTYVADAVHYPGDVVTHDGSTYQALRDTARAPPVDDWICLARAGRDASNREDNEKRERPDLPGRLTNAAKHARSV